MEPHRVELQDGLTVDFDLTGPQLLVLSMLAQLGMMVMGEGLNLTQAARLIAMLESYPESVTLAQQGLARLDAVMNAVTMMHRQTGEVS